MAKQRQNDECDVRGRHQRLLCRQFTNISVECVSATRCDVWPSSDLLSVSQNYNSPRWWFHSYIFFFCVSIVGMPTSAAAIFCDCVVPRHYPRWAVIWQFLRWQPQNWIYTTNCSALSQWCSTRKTHESLHASTAASQRLEHKDILRAARNLLF